LIQSPGGIPPPGQFTQNDRFRRFQGEAAKQHEDTMTRFTIMIAGKRVAVEALYESTRLFCNDYLAEGTPDFSVSITPEDIRFEREKNDREESVEGIPHREFSDEYLETLSVYRKIADRLPAFRTILFHGSAISVDGVGYLFTAKSGTGKSTHTRLWREYFGARAVMINDDKPLLRMEGSEVWVCGTPWNGKHRLGMNTNVPLAGICILERGEENRISPISSKEALHMLMQQSHRPSNPVGVLHTMDTLNEMMNAVRFYRLECNQDPQAALVAYEGMNRKD
jgi:hypothetical protein